MAHFDKDYLEFFSELEHNNHKGWFDQHRNVYQKKVREPFLEFIAQLIQGVQPLDPDIILEAKDAVFRINRDIRFSKDKTPYKTHMAGVLAPGGRKSRLPGFYIMASHKQLMLGGGLYDLDKEALHKVRTEIAYNPKEFEQVFTNHKFRQSYGEIKGEKNKVLPQEFKDDKDIPFIFNKQFYYMAELPAETILAQDVVQTCCELFARGNPLNQFLKKALLD